MSAELTRSQRRKQDVVLQCISSNFITLEENEQTFYKRHFNVAVRLLLDEMKEVDELFSALFQHHLPAGSYWINLKIGKPDEFDINLVLRLARPLRKNCKLLRATPSYVVMNVKHGFEVMRNSPKRETYKKMEDWFEMGFINGDKVRYWMQSVSNKAVNTLCKTTVNATEYKFSVREAGPSTTIQVEVCDSENIAFTIDLVPAFEFYGHDWPGHIRRCPQNIRVRQWQVVPKPLKDYEHVSNMSGQEFPPWAQWRISFQEQESHLIHNLWHFKPMIRFMKKLRDTTQEQSLLSSYAIKTVLMWEKDKHRPDFWRQSLISLFLHTLEILCENLGKEHIPFYWEEKQDLLEKLSASQKVQLHKTFSKVYNRIMEGLKADADQFVIASELLNEEEYLIFQKIFYKYAD